MRSILKGKLLQCIIPAKASQDVLSCQGVWNVLIMGWDYSNIYCTSFSLVLVITGPGCEVGRWEYQLHLSDNASCAVAVGQQENLLAHFFHLLGELGHLSSSTEFISPTENWSSYLIEPHVSLLNVSGFPNFDAKCVRIQSIWGNVCYRHLNAKRNDWKIHLKCESSWGFLHISGTVTSSENK